MICEIPNNVIQIDAFAKLFDGFSIGSNDLTQLTLGVDRDSEIVAFDFDERDEGVKEMIRLAVAGVNEMAVIQVSVDRLLLIIQKLPNFWLNSASTPSA